VTRVSVLGADGFVGKHVVNALHAAGHDVVAVSRKQASWPVAVEARIAAAGNWWTAVHGADVVVHLIARTHRTDEDGSAPEVLAAYREVNVDLTREVLAACAAEGVNRLVYMSSVKAMGERRSAPYTEEDVCHPVDAYGLTKLAAEDLVRAADIDSVVLRPPLVYGTGARGNVARLAGAIRRGLPLPLGRATAQRSLIAVENLADAAAVAATHPAAAGQTFLVSDRELLTVRDFVRALADGIGRPARLLPVPVPVLRAAGTIMRRTAEVDRLVRPLVVDATRISRTLDWQPPVAAPDALRRYGQTMA
jgi:nucleoside-diphosphate-sugar epimerase